MSRFQAGADFLGFVCRVAQWKFYFLDRQPNDIYLLAHAIYASGRSPRLISVIQCRDDLSPDEPVSRIATPTILCGNNGIWTNFEEDDVLKPSLWRFAPLTCPMELKELLNYAFGSASPYISEDEVAQAILSLCIMRILASHRVTPALASTNYHLRRVGEPIECCLPTPPASATPSASSTRPASPDLS